MDIIRRFPLTSIYLGWLAWISGDLELQLFMLGIATGFLLLSRSVAVWWYKDI